MTVARERDVGALIAKYGTGIEATPGLPCYLNALNALLVIFVNSNGGELPSIRYVETGVGVHIYLEYLGLVYNRGVTWPDGTFPDFSLSQTRELGQDITVQTLAGALEEACGDNQGSTGLGQLLRSYQGFTAEKMIDITRLALVTAVERSEEYCQILNEI